MEPVYEVHIRCTNPGIPHQLRYVNSTGRISWDVAVHMGKIDDLKVEVILDCKTVSLRNG